MDDLKWRLYSRWGLQRKYKPVNWRTGEQVGNLIFATVFTDEEKARVDTELTQTRDINKGLEWEFRRV